MSSDGSNNVVGENPRPRRNQNNHREGEVVTRQEFTQLQTDVRRILDRLEVRDRRSQSGSSHRRHSSEESDGNNERNRRQGERGERRKGIENIKLKIPPFTGSSKPEEFLDWVPRVEKLFECYEWDERTKVKMASLAFSDYATLWWDKLQTERRRADEEKIRTWALMKRLMRRRFVPDYYKQELLMDLQSLKQGRRSVEEYVKEFETLMARCDIQESTFESIARFINGLKMDIANVVELQQYQTLEDVIKLASRVERQQRRRYQKSHFHNKSDDEGKKEDRKDKGKDKEVEEKAPEQKKSREIKCFKCLGHGHIASQCPNKRVMVLKGNQLESEEEKPEYEQPQPTIEEYEQIVEHPVQGELLMVEQEEVVPDQRTNLFYIQGLVKGKTCLAVVDTGSCANLISADIVSKLGLQLEQHQNPYAIHWLNHQGAIHVHKQVRVPISTSEYSDEILCDVVPMDATHLILGRPWQYDLQVLFNGYKNEYIIHQRGQTYKLLPMRSEELQQVKLLHIKKTKGLKSLFAWTSKKNTSSSTPDVQKLKTQDSRSNLLQLGGNDRNQFIKKHEKRKAIKKQMRKAFGSVLKIGRPARQ